jgi:hypothetical protein
MEKMPLVLESIRQVGAETDCYWPNIIQLFNPLKPSDNYMPQLH